MLIKKLLKTLLFTSLTITTIANAKSNFELEYNINPEHYSSIDEHVHDDIYNYWYVTPDIVICNSSNAKKSQVIDAASVWKEAGFKVGKVYKESESTYSCPTNTEDIVYGVIFIIHDMQEIGKDNWGLTRKFYDWCDAVRTSSENHCIKGQGRHSYVISARIQLADDIQRNSRATTLIAHELGHALGFKHVDDYNDIMTSQPIGRYLPY
jgi:hypothetical protein